MFRIYRHTRLFCVLVCLLLAAHPALNMYYDLSSNSAQQDVPAYSLSNEPLSDRVVLIVLDSWALRMIESRHWMPKLNKRLSAGASGLLWQTHLTETANGIIALSSGIEPIGIDQQRLIFSHQQREWSIFDDVVAQGHRVMFAGGPLWVVLFGSRGTGNGPETGHGPDDRSDDLKGLARLETALRSPAPPSLSVLHISETDFAAHQYGTTSAAYSSVLGFWDDRLDSFLNAALTPGTTVILTADHGNDLNGSHGGGGDIYRRVPVLMWGAGVSPGAKFEMQAVDMPVTIAVLLGIRAPTNAVALPAVEALLIAPSERYRILCAAYTQVVLKNSRVTSNKFLFAKAQAAVVGKRNDVNGDISQLRESFEEFRPEISPQRGLHVSEWLYFAVSLLSAIGMLVMCRAAFMKSLRWCLVNRWLVGLGFLFIEGCLVLRFAGSSQLKSAFAHRSPVLMAASGIFLFSGGVLCNQAWQLRNPLLRWSESNPVAIALLGWLLISVLRPVTPIGFVGLVTTLAVIHTGDWTARERLVIGVFFIGYFVVGSLLIWPLCGESLFTRYAVGAPIALIAGSLLFLAQKRRTDAQNPSVWAMVAVLVAFPAGSMGFTGYSSTNPVLLASLITVAFCYGLSRISPISIWVWIAPASVIAFWWFPQSILFYAAFILCVIALSATLLQIRLSGSCRMGAFVSTLSLLLIMSTPPKCLSLLVYCGVLMAFLLTKPLTQNRERSIAILALMLVGIYYAIFDLYGGVTDSMLFVGMRDLDLGSAYVGDPARTIIPAILIAVFKAWAIFFLLTISITLFDHLRRLFTAIAGLAGTLLLLNIAQLSFLTAHAVHDRTQLYSGVLFSLLITTGMFVFGASAAGAVAWLHPAKKAPLLVLELENAN
jgi:hypothetical protein